MRELTEQIIKKLEEDEFDDALKPISPEEYFDIVIKPRLEKGKCTQNEDGSWSCKGNVDLGGLELKKLPIKFDIVHGNFDCAQNQLITLKGSPKYVGGSFDCDSNLLTNMEGAPDYIRSHLYADFNELRTLDGLGQVDGAMTFVENPRDWREMEKEYDDRMERLFNS